MVLAAKRVNEVSPSAKYFHLHSVVIDYAFHYLSLFLYFKFYAIVKAI